MTCLPSNPEPQGLCLDCDNRHGCRSAPPPCLAIERRPEERNLTGRALIRRRGRLPECRDCAHFRRCWELEDYERALRAL